MIAVLMLITYVPDLVLVVPRHFGFWRVELRPATRNGVEFFSAPIVRRIVRLASHFPAQRRASELATPTIAHATIGRRA
jgi:hypothetical protein